MANKELIAVPAASLPLDGTEYMYVVQGGNTRYVLTGEFTVYDAVDITYDNTTSGLGASDVQAALDEIALALSETGSVIIDGDKGDITLTSSGTVWTIDNDVVTNSKLSNMAEATLKGRASGAGTGDPTDLTGTQATVILDNMVGDSGSGGTKGLAPAPAAGDTAAGKFLKADGTWAVPPGSGGGDLDDLDDVNAPSPTNGQVLTWDSTPGEWVAADPTGGVGNGTSAWEFTVAASDETTDLTTGDSKVTFFMPSAVTLTEVFTGVSGQSSSGPVTIDVRKNGSTIFSTPPSIDSSEDTSLTGTAAVLSVTSFAKGDKIEIDIDAAGTGASGLKVTMLGTIVTNANAYDVPLAFPGTPEASQLLGKLIAVRDINFDANFDGSAGHVGVNPDATYEIDVQDDGASIGTISISTGGVYTFTTTSGTAKTVASGSRIEFYGDSVADASIVDIAATLKGTV